MLPMMREGLTPPMDSVPLPVERRHLGVLTSLSAAVLLAFVALATWLHATGSPVADVVEPARALAVVVGRSLDLDDGIDGAPEWERRVYRSLLGSRADDLADALRWYEELEGESLEPSVDLHLAILEGEAGRAPRLRGRFGEGARRRGPVRAFPHPVALAYPSVGAGGGAATRPVAPGDAPLEP